MKKVISVFLIYSTFLLCLTACTTKDLSLNNETAEQENLNYPTFAYSTVENPYNHALKTMREIFIMLRVKVKIKILAYTS